MANEFLTYVLLKQQEAARLNRFALPQPANAGTPLLLAPVGNELSLALAGPQLKTQEDYLNFLKNAGKVNTNDAGYKAALKQAQKNGETVKYLGTDGKTYAVNPEGKAHFVSNSDVAQHVFSQEKSPIVRNSADVTTPVETTPTGIDKKVVDKATTPAPTTSTPVEKTPVGTSDVEAPKGTKKHKKESGFQRMEREAAENMGKGSGLKFQEGSGKGKQPGDYAGVHVDQKAHNKKQTEYDKMFADLDKADKEARKAAVEANKGKKSGVVGADAKAAIEQNKANAQADELEKLRKENEKLKADSQKRREKIAQWKKDRQAMKKPADKFQEFSGKKLDTDYAKVADVDPVIHAEKQAKYDKLFGKTDDVADVAKKGKKLGKWGKWGLIAAAVGLAAWGISKLAKKDDAVQPEETTPVVPPVTPEEETPETPVVPPVTPVVPPVTPEPEEEEDATQKEYEVKKGDNVWNIAKAQLKEELGRIPTNKEIRERTEIIIEKNGLKWEDDNYTVIIQPGDKLNIAA